jgi:WD40 repeat protein
LVSNTATFQPTVSKTARPSETFTQTPRPTPALSPVPTTNSAATLNAEATADALEGLCDEFKTDSSRYSRISPNGEWAAITCGYKRNQTLVVQNQVGARWVLKFADFLGSGFEEMPGSFAPLAWSADGRFLYFSKVLGYSGGGNQCFPGFGVDGLFRLHLRTGTLTTFIPSSDGFPGNEIRFSPTNEFYAVDIDGVRITNVVSGKVTSIHSPGVMEMSWSPDGNFLAYSVATCGEDLVEASSIFVWDASTNETQLLFSTQEMLLRPDSWIHNSTLRFEGEKWVNQDNLYTIFEYDLRADKMILSGTATPRP